MSLQNLRSRGFNSRPVFLLGVFFVLLVIAMIFKTVSAHAAETELPTSCEECMAVLRSLKAQADDPTMPVTADYLYEDMVYVAEKCEESLACPEIKIFMGVTLAEFQKRSDWVGPID